MKLSVQLLQISRKLYVNWSKTLSMTAHEFLFYLIFTFKKNNMRRFLKIFHVVELLFSNKNMRRTIFFFEEKSPQSIQFPKFLE